MEMNEAPKMYETTLEISYWHLPGTPFHKILQKVEG
jgi:hypothetical protein